MHSSNLNDDERYKLIILLARHRDGLGKVIERMKARDWLTNDPLYNDLLSAHHALQAAISSMPQPGKTPPLKQKLDPQAGSWAARQLDIRKKSSGA